jgi:hypothetical protein
VCVECGLSCAAITVHAEARMENIYLKLEGAIFVGKTIRKRERIAL